MKNLNFGSDMGMDFNDASEFYFFSGVGGPGMKIIVNSDKSLSFKNIFCISTIENFYLWFIFIIEKRMGISLGGLLSLFNLEV
jgi:hypothetical protein